MQSYTLEINLLIISVIAAFHNLTPHLNVMEGYISHQSAGTCEISEQVRSARADDSR